MTALLEFFHGSAAEPVDRLQSGVGEQSCGFFRSQILSLEVGIVEAVAEEVDQIRNNGFRPFFFQQFRQIVVGCRKEFYQDFSNNADSRLLLIGDRDIVEVADHRTADLFKTGVAYTF